VHQWKVVPISENQKLDVRPDDLLNNGHFRKCSTYRGGGGYDKFPEICYMWYSKRYSEQFVVQLYGCHLDCYYCYVTRAGVWGKPVLYSTDELINAFLDSEQQIFHLMGGAPALQIEYWPELIKALSIKAPDAVFHSDLLLTEFDYSEDVLAEIAEQNNVLLAISIKGIIPEEHLVNTRKSLDEDLLQRNLMRVLNSHIPCYLTFTAISEECKIYFLNKVIHSCLVIDDLNYLTEVINSSYCINLIEYEAVDHVDCVPSYSVSKKNKFKSGGIDES
jgi:uncharacterized Fe-S cluster-containing radical SAM superfamily protein